MITPIIVIYMQALIITQEFQDFSYPAQDNHSYCINCIDKPGWVSKADIFF